MSVNNHFIQKKLRKASGLSIDLRFSDVRYGRIPVI
jgi:hypothetical protein